MEVKGSHDILNSKMLMLADWISCTGVRAHTHTQGPANGGNLKLIQTHGL